MSLRFALILIPLVLTSCSVGEFFENYRVPTGWAHLDTTPISTPHGYNKTSIDEDAVRDVQAVDANAWLNGIATALMPISSVLDMTQPVAVVATSPLTPLNASAANYTRDLLINMSYLIALPQDTPQHVHVSATRTGKTDDNQVTLNVQVVRNDIVYASRMVDITVPRQAAENIYLPNFSLTSQSLSAPTPKETMSPYNE